MHFDIVIIGGGSTGTAIFRDLCLRGLDSVLIEKNRISGGTTQHSHHNLVGGMRYVIKDRDVARDCAEENRILRKIAPRIIGSKGNYFIGFRNDYVEEALKQAKKIGVFFKELEILDVLKEVPSLNGKIEIAYLTDDRNINVSEFCRLNCLSAIENGGELLENTDIVGIERSDGYRIKTKGGIIESDYIVNATGPWTNSIAELLDVNIPLIYSQGTIIVQETLSERSIQYFHEPSDGDAYIVHGNHAWLGTTSTRIGHPLEAEPESWAEEYLKEKFSDIIPKVRTMPCLQKFSGVRPLMGDQEKENSRQISRDYQVVEPIEGFISIIGGKLTTSRLMAETVSDYICKRIGNEKSCRTATESLED
jgi:glycerol-3-phosphate dehydrogenase